VISVNVRVVAATHRDLPAAVKEGLFREDLWYRLQVVPIILPPLRERFSDVLQLAEHFLRLISADTPKRLTPAAAKLLLAYHWPGNVRELRNAMERAAVLSHGQFIDAEHIGLQTGSGPAPRADIDWNGTMADAVSYVEREMIMRALANAAGSRSDAARRLGISRQQLYRKLEEFGIS
jgi:DNA-binding NtrC family response regulator